MTKILLVLTFTRQPVATKMRWYAVIIFVFVDCKCMESIMYVEYNYRGEKTAIKAKNENS